MNTIFILIQILYSVLALNEDTPSLRSLQYENNHQIERDQNFKKDEGTKTDFNDNRVISDNTPYILLIILLLVSLIIIAIILIICFRHYNKQQYEQLQNPLQMEESPIVHSNSTQSLCIPNQLPQNQPSNNIQAIELQISPYQNQNFYQKSQEKNEIQQVSRNVQNINPISHHQPPLPSSLLLQQGQMYLFLNFIHDFLNNFNRKNFNPFPLQSQLQNNFIQQQQISTAAQVSAKIVQLQMLLKQVEHTGEVLPGMNQLQQHLLVQMSLLQQGIIPSSSAILLPLEQKIQQQLLIIQNENNIKRKIAESKGEQVNELIIEHQNKLFESYKQIQSSILREQQLQKSGIEQPGEYKIDYNANSDCKLLNMSTPTLQQQNNSEQKQNHMINDWQDLLNNYKNFFEQASKNEQIEINPEIQSSQISQNENDSEIDFEKRLKLLIGNDDEKPKSFIQPLSVEAPGIKYENQKLSNGHDSESSCFQNKQKDILLLQNNNSREVESAPISQEIQQFKSKQDSYYQEKNNIEEVYYPAYYDHETKKPPEDKVEDGGEGQQEEIKQKASGKKRYQQLKQKIKSQQINQNEEEETPNGNADENEFKSENITCRKCQTNSLSVIFQCSHVLCKSCSDETNICPFCKLLITSKSPIFFN